MRWSCRRIWERFKSRLRFERSPAGSRVEAHRVIDLAAVVQSLGDMAWQTTSARTQNMTFRRSRAANGSGANAPKRELGRRVFRAIVIGMIAGC
jgi:hypothetical protein